MKSWIIRGRGRHANRWAVRLAAAAVVCAAFSIAAAPAAQAATYEKRPVLFVHGFESAGSNFASQSKATATRRAG